MRETRWLILLRQICLDYVAHNGKAAANSTALLRDSHAGCCAVSSFTLMRRTDLSMAAPTRVGGLTSCELDGGCAFAQRQQQEAAVDYSTVFPHCRS